jgi:DNA-binding response OmpR family regulator
LHLLKQDHWAFFDRDKLEKVLLNLLSNALKFTSAGGAVAVTATVELVANPPAYRLVVTVADTGIGIAPEQLPHIFDRFYQGDNSTTRAYEGSGIGLALAKELTELHGGEITVESTPGEGTVFKVILTLPLAQEDRQAAAMPPVTLMPPAAGEPEYYSMAEVTETSRKNQTTENEAYETKVLVVEDDADLRRYICKHLSSEYVVLEAENGAVGWVVALETLPDLVVSDVMMPEVDGLTLCQRLKQHATTAHIPVVLLTARVEREDKIGGLLIGADDYLTKPFHVQELMVRAHNLIEARKKLRELFHREMLLHPEETKVPSADDIFLKGVIEVIHQHMDNDQFGLEELCREIGLSRTQLYRKLFALTSQGPSDFIRTLRLRQAASLLRQRAGNVAEIAYRVGFRDASTFSRAFTKEFGCPPSEYAQKQVL